jgi:hypothetical protein
MSDTEKDRQIREQFDRYIVDSKVATVGRIRELLLSDEFMTAFAKKFHSTPLPHSIHSVTWGTVDLSNADANQGVAKCQIQ